MLKNLRCCSPNWLLCLLMIAFFFLLSIYQLLTINFFTNNFSSSGDSNDGAWMVSACDCPLAIRNETTADALKKVRVVVGISIGALEFFVLLLGLWFWKKNEEEDQAAFCTLRDLDNMARKFSYDDLVCATNNFSEKDLLGKGGFGSVYKGFLKELNCHVAVKRLSSGSGQGIKEFAYEVKIISQLRHRNVVGLIGWCCERKELLLVYEFMANGSLDSHLFKENSSLAWETRFKIAHGVASGLLYLHDGWEKYVVHRDVKASNIMLDSDFNAKLGDFGLARLGVHGKRLENSSLEGTIGYVAPEYATLGRASKGSDVFSFGSVALEIACGRKVIDRPNFRGWIWDLYGEGKLLDAVDPRLNGEFDKQQVECLMIVGLWCVHPDAQSRPTMEKAIHVLKFVAPLPQLPSEMPMTSIFAPFSSSSAGTDMEERNNQSPRSGSNKSFTRLLVFRNKKKFVKRDFLANFRGFGREMKFGLPKGDFAILKGLRREMKFSLPKGDFAFLRGFQRELNFGLKRDFSIFRRLRREMNFGRQKQTPKRGKINKRKPYQLKCTELIYDHCRIFSFDDMRSATNNFKESFLIGAGGFGKVYIGYMDNGSKVAIKRCAENSNQGSREFGTEISMLSKLKHRHLVSLIGFCSEKREMILVYEYMAQGTLRDHLFKNQKSPLPWKQRLKICIGAAQGLHYLHAGANNTIIHRDIKSSNILLDDNLVAKVSDFGISREMRESDWDVSTVVMGTFGYLDPEYIRTQRVTEKSDVYSFGVVLFEVLCARPSMDANEGLSLADLAIRCHQMGTLDEITDPYLKGKIAPECFNTFTDIAIQCLADRGSQRPSMRNVLYSLELAIEQQIASELQGNIDPDVPVMTDDGESISYYIHSSLNSRSIFRSESENSDTSLKDKNCINYYENYSNSRSLNRGISV